MSRIFVTGRESGEFSIDAGKKGWNPSNNPTDSLQNLSNDLVLQGILKFERNDISVPSPWASLILFDTLLTSKDEQFNRLRDKAKNEWRALMFIIATSPIYGDYVRYHTVDLTSDIDRTAADKNFFKNILNMKPKTGLFGEENSWNKMTFINVDDYNIGILSDSFLVCSNHTYSENVTAMSRLKAMGLVNDDNEFVDPTKIISRDRALMVYMISWLEKVKNVIAKRENSTAAALAELIEQFENDIKEAKKDSNALEKFWNPQSGLMVWGVSKEDICSAEDVVTSIYLDKLVFKQETDIFAYMKLDQFKVYMLDGFGEKLNAI